MSWWIEFRYFSFIFAIDTSAFLIIPSWMDENGLGYYTASFVMIIFLIFVSFARWGLRTSAVTALILNVACFTTCQIAMTGTVFFLHMDIMPFEEEVRRIAFQAALSFIMIIVLSRSAGALQIDDTRLSPDVLEIDYVAKLKTAIAQAGARGGTLYWGHVDAHPSTWLGLTMTNSLHSTSTMQNEQITLPSDQLQAKLVDMNSRRAIGLDNDGRLIASTATQVDDAILAPIGRRNGIWTRLETASWAGWLALVDVRAAGWDKLVLAREIARHAEQALIQVELQALTNNAAVTRWRQSVARDLHDGVAQSLMGAQYWLRAMLRKEGRSR